MFIYNFETEKNISEASNDEFLDLPDENAKKSHDSFKEAINQQNNNDTQINLGVDVMNIHSKLNTTHYIYISIAEIYNEQIFDLLEFPTEEGFDLKRKSLKINGDNKRGFYVKKLRSILVSNADEAFKVLEVGLQNRRIAETKMNANSSRR